MKTLSPTSLASPANKIRQPQLSNIVDGRLTLSHLRFTIFHTFTPPFITVDFHPFTSTVAAGNHLAGEATDNNPPSPTTIDLRLTVVKHDF
ncbi:hypothetical protein HanRHA438_Chr13g0620701 [Helianthus annuus]|nr:hypothetical protein HanRHA438_Chr13g0620701 [Helianthus annuus]